MRRARAGRGGGMRRQYECSQRRKRSRDRTHAALLEALEPGSARAALHPAESPQRAQQQARRPLEQPEREFQTASPARASELRGECSHHVHVRAGRQPRVRNAVEDPCGARRQRPASLVHTARCASQRSATAASIRRPVAVPIADSSCSTRTASTRRHSRICLKACGSSDLAPANTLSSCQRGCGTVTNGRLFHRLNQGRSDHC